LDNVSSNQSRCSKNKVINESNQFVLSENPGSHGAAERSKGGANLADKIEKGNVFVQDDETMDPKATTLNI